GSIYFILHHGLVKMNLFLVSGAVFEYEGHTNLKKLGSLLSARPLLGYMFLIASLALAGIPILSGFWAKLSLVYGGLLAGQWPVIAAALAVSVLTLFSMIKIWLEVFWKDRPEPEVVSGEPGKATVPDADAAAAAAIAQPLPKLLERRTGEGVLLGVIVAVNIVIIAIGFAAGPIFDYTLAAAEQLVHPVVYLETVLGADFPELVAAMSEDAPHSRPAAP
ncbi:MAG: proton-conducting transporter membrane subunit, partial [Planctomycetota bacterium]